MVKLILTDLGNVVCRFWDRKKLFKCIVAHFGGNPQGVERLFPDVTNPGEHNEGLYEQLDTGRVNMRYIWSELCHKCGIREDSLPYDLFCSILIGHLEPILPVIKLYQKLYSDGVRFVAVSNGDLFARAFAEQLRIYHNLGFAHVLISCEQRVKKPAMLETRVVPWLQKEGIDAKDCVFVDDLEQYCKAARILGLHAICYNATKQGVDILYSELAKHGIRV
ncbi:MAG: hypothetical protein A2826_00105 [Candidatus Doudnabacteria bacterium RIFCSPHIGHO2_01_FULL_43_23]|uniref:Haloacid dehalogenase n=1 Tax=Candidatus Doudnabacteria bacterium RIFCSPHIGHO2_01_FULL_43_23 TaxID=1817822 RepID=A0A1F5NQH6_9BACT|nr:MAG: hypothetical protein A2826_00105 [Candidatus Doudnabacteria bacterium RIFCSPHIGHO2_01_FULL_43_23]